jgi:hypothetical protein
VTQLFTNHSFSKNQANSKSVLFDRVPAASVLRAGVINHQNQKDGISGTPVDSNIRHLQSV